MENSFIMSYIDGGISCNNLPQYFHCIMIPKAERPVRQTHPIVFLVLSLRLHPQSSGPQRRIFFPLWKGMHSAVPINSYS